MTRFEANYSIQVLESQIPLPLMNEDNRAINVRAPCCWVLSNCGVVVLKSLLILALLQELVPVIDERAGCRTAENGIRRAHLRAAHNERDDDDQRVFCFQQGAIVFSDREAARQKITKPTARTILSRDTYLTWQAVISDKQP